VFEMMFTRPMYETPDMHEQGNLLAATAKLIDNGNIITTVKDVVSPINAENMRSVHSRIEQGKTIGKIVLEGWG
jgi:NADPH:quinone reductase